MLTAVQKMNLSYFKKKDTKVKDQQRSTFQEKRSFEDEISRRNKFFLCEKMSSKVIGEEDDFNRRRDCRKMWRAESKTCGQWIDMDNTRPKTQKDTDEILKLVKDIKVVKF